MSLHRGLPLSLVVLGSIALNAPAKANDIVEAVMGVVICTALKDDKERLACFDKSASALKNAGVPNTPETANTKDIVNNFSPNDYKVVDADDVHVAPRKFLNKPIELRGVRCFYADKDDYRCLTRSKLPTVVFSSSIGPSAEKDSLESDCGAIKKLDSPACRKTVRLVPIDYTEDSPNAFAKRIILRAATIEIVSAPTGRSRR